MKKMGILWFGIRQPVQCRGMELVKGFDKIIEDL